MRTRRPLHLQAHSIRRAANHEYYNQVTEPALARLDPSSPGLAHYLDRVYAVTNHQTFTLS